VRKIISLLILSCMFFTSCVSVNNNSIPNWFINQYDSSYSKNNYICAVGAGESKEEAEENAKVSLSQIFNTSIKSATVTFDNDTTSSMSSRGYIDTSVDDLVGVSVINTQVDNNGTFYVRVALDKKIASNKIRSIITPKNNEINSLMMDNSKSNFVYLQNLLRAKNIALTIQNYYDQLSVLENATVVSPLMNIENKIAKIKETLAISVVVNAQDIQQTNDLKKVVETMLLNSGVDINANGSTLEIEYKDSLAPPKDNLYQCTFTLKAQLIDKGNVVFSLDKTSRAIGISENSAKEKALEKAMTIIEGELF